MILWLNVRVLKLLPYPEFLSPRPKTFVTRPETFAPPPDITRDVIQASPQNRYYSKLEYIVAKNSLY